MRDVLRLSRLSMTGLGARGLHIFAAYLDWLLQVGYHAVDHRRASFEDVERVVRCRVDRSVARIGALIYWR